LLRRIDCWDEIWPVIRRKPLCPWHRVVSAGTLMFEGKPSPTANVFAVMLPEIVARSGGRFHSPSVNTTIASTS
jgi:hypothetical protein